ncbi:MAG TPA: DUF805 domain-containing protein [Flavobacteriaceae bacterium]|nr:DUF805 domain-containing protein [Flavobacteriaceae bacterium]
MKWYLKGLRKYAEFNGRARRKEYWMFVLFNMIFSFVAAVIDNLAGIAIPEMGYGLFYGLFVLVMFIPGLAVTVRRLHDIGKSGWMFFVVLIPLIGGIWLFILMLTDSDPGVNQYGANPKEVTALNI